MDHDKKNRLLHFTDDERDNLGGIETPQMDIHAALYYAEIAVKAVEAARDVIKVYNCSVYDWDYARAVDSVRAESSALEALKHQLAAAIDFVMDQPPHLPAVGNQNS